MLVQVPVIAKAVSELKKAAKRDAASVNADKRPRPTGFLEKLNIPELYGIWRVYKRVRISMLTGLLADRSDSYDKRSHDLVLVSVFIQGIFEWDEYDTFGYEHVVAGDP